MNKVKKFVLDFYNLFSKVEGLTTKITLLEQKIEQQNVLMGNLSTKVISHSANSINEAEFRVFSQFGDDGIIQYLLKNSTASTQSFVEFGVENYTESNTRFLLLNNNWKGMILDGSEKNINFVKRDDLYWRHDLTAVTAFIDRDNINSLLQKNGFTGDLGILHIDIDGNDYWVWKEISVVNPEIVIVEYNSVFGYENPWTVEYDPKFIRSNYHHNNLYWGVSLLSLCDLAEEKGYDFVGCNENGNNAYFVRKDKMGALHPVSVKTGYRASKFRESRDEKGQLTYLTGKARLASLDGMKIYNTRTQQVENI